MRVKKDLSNQQIEFCKNYAKYNEAYKAAIEAGYTPKTAKAKSAKWLDDSRIQQEIAYWQKKAQVAIEKKFSYTIEESFKKLQEIQELAYDQDEKGKFYNLTVAAKVEELKGKLAGLYVEKQQIDGVGVNITFNRNYD